MCTQALRPCPRVHFFHALWASVALSVVVTPALCQTNVTLTSDRIPKNDLIDSGTVSAGSPAAFNFEVNPSTQFVLLRLSDALTNLNVTLPLDTNVTVGAMQSVSGDNYILLKPSHMVPACTSNSVLSNPCTLQVQVTTTAVSATAYTLSGYYGEMLPFNNLVSRSGLARNTSFTYGLEVADKDLDVHVVLTPDQTVDKMDLDLFCCESPPVLCGGLACMMSAASFIR